MALIPKKPEESKSKSLDDIILQQELERNIKTGVTTPEEKKKEVKEPKIVKPALKPSKVVKAKSPKATTAIKAKEEERKEETPQEPVAAVLSQRGRVATVVLKNTIFNLPVELIERIAVVANEFHAGNKSHFARQVFEEAVAAAEKRMKK